MKYKKEECNIKIGKASEPGLYLHKVPTRGTKDEPPPDPKRLTPDEIKALRKEVKDP